MFDDYLDNRCAWYRDYLKEKVERYSLNESIYTIDDKIRDVSDDVKAITLCGGDCDAEKQELEKLLAAKKSGYEYVVNGEPMSEKMLFIELDMITVKC